jgi:hypothetical protein
MERARQMHSFKDFIVVDYRPGRDDQSKYNAQKNKRSASEGVDDPNRVYATEAEVDEALTTQQRIKMKQIMRRNKAKIQLGKRRAARKIATMDVLKKRARRQARKAILKKILKNKDKSDLSYSTRAAFEKMVNKRQTAINRLAKKLLPQVRKADREKLKRNTNPNSGSAEK